MTGERLTDAPMESPCTYTHRTLGQHGRRRDVFSADALANDTHHHDQTVLEEQAVGIHTGRLWRCARGLRDGLPAPVHDA
jgi:hypothetical protein